MKILFPSDITAENSERYDLFLRLWKGGFSFSGFISGEKDSFFHKTVFPDSNVSYMDFLKNVFFENECMKYSCKSLNVVCVTEKYTMVPEDVYMEKSKEELLSFCTGTSENHKTMSQHIKNQNYIILYELDSKIYEFLVRSFISANFIHFLSPMLDVWHQNSLTAYPKHIYVNIRKEVIDIAGFEHGDLIFVNSFRYENENDLLYFAVYVLKQIGFNQLEDELFLCGETSVCKSVIKVLKTYFEHITLLSKKMEKYGIPLDEEVPYDIITLTKCGL
ncbi:MAG: DUF3822 family protein [Tannerella sp.]|jgi:hypothetical protein|nr:DUF3822 family protein [Tannerella sp.]